MISDAYNMDNETRLEDYIGKDVVHMLEFIKENENMRLDYKLIGNDYGMTLVLRFGQQPLTIQGQFGYV